MPASSQSCVKSERRKVLLTSHTDSVEVLPIASEASDSAFHLQSKASLGA